MTEDNHQALKRLMEEAILRDTSDSLTNLFNDLVSQCEAKSVMFDWGAAIEHWWHLARLGVVAIPGAHLGGVSVGGRPRHIFLTERGRRYLERGEKSPHDPPRYLEAVRKRVEGPDEIALTYLDEAVGAWVAELYRASAVMLGCACERLVLILADKIIAAGAAPWSAKIDRELKATPTRISRLFDLVRNCLSDLRGRKKLPAPLGDALDRKLSAIFDHARGLRNKLGHPTGEAVSREDAEAGLLMFPGFYALVDELCAAL